jgi:phage head maturation protease
MPETTILSTSAKPREGALIKMAGQVVPTGDLPEDTVIVKAYPYQLDRDGTTIRPSAWTNRLANYLANPIVSFGHDTWSKPTVAKSNRVWVIDGQPGDENAGIWAEIKFAPTDMGRDLALLYKGGFMNAVSITAFPHNWEQVGRDFPGQTGPTYTDVELVDISCVPIPSNAGALVVQRGATNDAEQILIKTWGEIKKAMPEDKTVTKTYRPVSYDEVKEIFRHSDEEECSILLKSGEIVAPPWRVTYPPLPDIRQTEPVEKAGRKMSGKAMQELGEIHKMMNDANTMHKEAHTRLKNFMEKMAKPGGGGMLDDPEDLADGGADEGSEDANGNPKKKAFDPEAFKTEVLTLVQTELKNSTPAPAGGAGTVDNNSTDPTKVVSPLAAFLQGWV